MNVNRSLRRLEDVHTRNAHRVKMNQVRRRCSSVYLWSGILINVHIFCSVDHVFSLQYHKLSIIL